MEGELNYYIPEKQSDEDQYVELLIQCFQNEYGYSLHDNRNAYDGPHISLLCEHRGKIIGGISAYIAEGQNCRLPMEKRGVIPSITKYAPLLSGKYCEICRGVVLSEYRRFQVYPALMKKMMGALMQIDCKTGFWVSKKYFAQYIDGLLLSMGVNVATLDVVKYDQSHNGRSVEIEYHLSCGNVPGVD